MATPYNINPKPQTGADSAYGFVPGALSIPDLLGDITSLIPNLPELTSEASSQILSRIRGEFTPKEEAEFQDIGARFGQSSGMPGSGLSLNKAKRERTIAANELSRQGLSEFQSFLPTIARTLTVSPETQIGTAGINAMNAAAPNPFKAQTTAQNLFNKYLGQLSQSGPQNQNRNTNPAGGTGAFNPFSAFQQASPLKKAAPAMPKAPAVPGWGQTWNNQGEYADTGNIPSNVQQPYTQPYDVPNEYDVLNNYALPPVSYNPSLNFGAWDDFDAFDTSGNYFDAELSDEDWMDRYVY